MKIVNHFINAYLSFVLFFVTTNVIAQIENKTLLLDIDELNRLQNLYISNNRNVTVDLKKFIKNAEKLLKMKPLSVVDKDYVPPSGDKHDFVSMGPYWWPDPSKPNGLPYIRKDGERNPEYKNITDESYLNKTINAVEHLAIANYITKNSKFAAKALQLLSVWFIEPETRMNPNMKHAQFIPGINTGRGIGLIETRYLFKVTDAIVLLRLTNDLEIEKDAKLKMWFEEYFSWITTHEYGITESNEKNNHGTWYDVQSSAIAIFLGKIHFAKNILENAKHKRIDSQITAEGKQPLELARTKSWNYSLMNLTAFMHLAIISESLNIDLWNYESQEGGSIRKALDYLLPFALNNHKWEYRQIEKMSNAELFPLLKAAQIKYDKKVYADWINKIFDNKTPSIGVGQRIKLNNLLTLSDKFISL